LLLMAEMRRADEWSRAAPVMLILANAFRDPKQRRRPYELSDFDPFAKRVERAKVPITVLRDVFIEGKRPGGK
jgi:hypothetical protein